MPVMVLRYCFVADAAFEAKGLAGDVNLGRVHGETGAVYREVNVVVVLAPVMESRESRGERRKITI